MPYITVKEEPVHVYLFRELGDNELSTATKISREAAGIRLCCTRSNGCTLSWVVRVGAVKCAARRCVVCTALMDSSSVAGKSLATGGFLGGGGDGSTLGRPPQGLRGVSPLS
jgi:hypothetical protein